MSCAFPFCNAELGIESPDSSIVKHIGIVLYEDFSLVGISNLTEALDIANGLQRSTKRRRLTYIISLLSARGGIVTSSSSIGVFTSCLGAQCSPVLDALYVAGGTGVTRALEDDRGLIELLSIASSESATISALGSGHALLTAAGLTCDTCTSLGRAAPMGGVYPKRPNDERSHALMYALALIKQDLGYDIASSVVDCLLDNQHISIMMSEMATPTVAEKTQESARWLERNCGKPVSVVDAAHNAAMSDRNFFRHFKREMGLTPSQYLLHARLRLSCELLTNSELSIDKIARRSGLSSGERLSKLFRKEFSISPTEYRVRNREES